MFYLTGFGRPTMDELKTFRRLEDAIFGAASDEKGPNDYAEWEKQYLRLHRNRYMSNLDAVRRFVVDRNVLEIGSVPCHFTALLTGLGYKVIGIDPKPERAARIIQRFDLDIRRCDLELEPLPFAADSFSGIVFSEVIEHMYVNPLHALREIARVLAPHGVLLLFTDNLDSLRTLKSFFQGNSINDAVAEWLKLDQVGHRGHIRLYSPKEVRNLLSVVGLVPIYHGYRQYAENLRSRMIYTFVPPSLYPNQLVVATKKVA